MVIKHKGNQEYYGLSSDSKPVPADTAVNATFDETDTGNQYRNNGTAWIAYGGGAGGGGDPDAIETLTNKTISFDTNTFPLTPTSTYYTVYRAGTTTKCRDNVTGTIISSSSTNPEVPIQFMLDNLTRKSGFIADGSYNVLAGTTFQEGQAECRLYLDAGALFNVPQGFAQSALGIPKNTSLIKIQGGKFSELGTPQSLWTCISLNNQTTTSEGIKSCEISDMYIRHPLHSIKLTSGTTTSTIDSNRFWNIYTDRMVNGVTFVQSVAKTSSNGSNLNTFWNIIMQMSAATPLSLRGFNDISGDSNQFYGCAVWDTAAGSLSANLTTEATNTFISGGKMTQRFEDLGSGTLAWDSANGLKMGRSNFSTNKALMGATSQQSGTMQGYIGEGTGCLQTPTVPTGCTLSNNAVYADGPFVRYTSTATAGDNAGFRTTFPVTYRGWYPYFECNFRVPSPTNSRLYIGWGSATEPTSDAPYNAESAIGIGYRTTDTNFQIYRNDGVSTVTYSDVFLIAKDANIHNVKILANDANNSWQAILDGISITTLTNVPTQQQALYPTFQIETTSGVKTLDRFSVDIRPGKNTLV